MANGRPDIVIRDKNGRIVALKEVKHVEKLTKAHIYQTANYYPRSQIPKSVVIARKTEVPDNVKKIADGLNIKIERKRVDFH